MLAYTHTLEREKEREAKLEAEFFLMTEWNIFINVCVEAFIWLLHREGSRALTVGHKKLFL